MDFRSIFRNRGGVTLMTRWRPFPVLALYQILAVSIILLLVPLRPCQAAQNVTVDDRDPSIEYVGDERVQWERMEWRMSSGPRANALTWMSTWEDPLDGDSPPINYVPSYQIRFNFSGTALYLSYPLWPTQASTGTISVDGSPPTTIDLRDTTQTSLFAKIKNLPPSAPSKIRYALEDLSPGPHSLVISAVPGSANQNFWVVFDSLIYTNHQLDPVIDSEETVVFSPADPTFSPVDPTSSPPESTLSTSNNSSPQPQNNKKVTIIATCASVVFVALLALVLFIICRKRRRQEKERNPYGFSGVETDPKAHVYEAQVTLAPPSGHGSSYRDLEALASSPASPPSSTHQTQQSAEALLQRDIAHGNLNIVTHKSQESQNDRGTLHVQNRMSTMTATDESGTAPPPYDAPEHSAPMLPPVPEKSPVILRYPGSSAAAAANPTVAGGSTTGGDGRIRRAKSAV